MRVVEPLETGVQGGDVLLHHEAGVARRVSTWCLGLVSDAQVSLDGLKLVVPQVCCQLAKVPERIAGVPVLLRVTQLDKRHEEEDGMVVHDVSQRGRRWWIGLSCEPLEVRGGFTQHAEQQSLGPKMAVDLKR